MTDSPVASAPSEEVPVRDAATVMLLRDGADGLEVFMLRRNLQSDFVGGAYVFPGGGVDDHDAHADLEAVCDGMGDAEASAALGLDAGGLAFWVAVIRECFEEAGVLLARWRDGDASLVSFDDPAVAERFDVHRRAVDRGERRLVEVCEEEGLVLTVDRLAFASHWVTPEGPHRRYDTRFFVGLAPTHQVPLHDDREVIDNLWVRPTDALERHRRGELEMIFPTVRNLEWLAAFTSAGEAIEAARSLTDIPRILPRIVPDGRGGMKLVLPGDPDYGVEAPAPRLPKVAVTRMAAMARERATGDERERS
jgi:8-oxo-dGTP pyrophosphatase MutT (NUDIX family)